MNATRFALLHTDFIVSVVSQYFEYQDDVYKFLLVNPSWARVSKLYLLTFYDIFRQSNNFFPLKSFFFSPRRNISSRMV